MARRRRHSIRGCRRRWADTDKSAAPQDVGRRTSLATRAGRGEGGAMKRIMLLSLCQCLSLSRVVDGAQLAEHARIMRHEAGEQLQPADGGRTVAHHVSRQRKLVQHLPDKGRRGTGGSGGGSAMHMTARWRRLLRLRAPMSVHAQPPHPPCTQASTVQISRSPTHPHHATSPSYAPPHCPASWPAASSVASPRPPARPASGSPGCTGGSMNGRQRAAHSTTPGRGASCSDRVDRAVALVGESPVKLVGWTRGWMPAHAHARRRR